MVATNGFVRLMARVLTAAAIAVISATVGASAGDARFTPAQLAEIQQRFVLAKQIVARLAPDAARLQLAPSWQQATLSLLLSNNSTRLAELAKIGGYQAVIKGATQRDGAMLQKALGDAASDLVFKPFTPCRYIDTRNVGGKISGAPRTFDLANNGATYGGDGGCDPKTLAGVASEDQIGAIAFNIAYVDTSAGAPGFLTVRPAGSTQVTAMLNWWQAAASAQDSNAAISAINQTGPAEFEILSSGPVQVIMDLLGAFLSPSATALDCATVTNPSGSSATGDVPAGTSAIFQATCATGYTITGGGCTYFTTAQVPPAATDNKVILNRSLRPFDQVNQVFLNAWTCHWTNTDSVTWRVQTRAVCCRVPGR